MTNNLKSIATVSLSGTLSEKLYAIAKAGFNGVEIFENDLSPFIQSPQQITTISKDLGLNIFVFQPFRNFEGAPRCEIPKIIEQVKYKFDVMNNLGASILLVCSNVAPDAITDDNLIIDDLYLLAKCAAQHGIKIGYEALCWGRHIKSYKQAWNIIKQVDHPSLGLILDSFHILAINDSLTELNEISVEKIFFVQLADAPRLAMNLINWSRHFRCYPGAGDFAINDFVAQLIANGYNGPLSLEIFSDQLQVTSPSIAANDGMLAMLNLDKKVSGLLNVK
jgi:4-hydroxyphenylpyruvate dioxygenase